MTISIVSVTPNQTVPRELVAPIVLRIFSGVIELVFKGNSNDAVLRDTLTFTVGRVNFPGLTTSPVASAVVSPTSIAYDGAVNNALWAVDGASVPSFVNVDSGSGTADLQVVAQLGIRGLNGIILRVNYTVFYFPET
jgi:hypothetical protein